MKHGSLLLATLLLAACDPIGPFAEGRGDDRNFGEVDPMQAAPAARVIDTAPVAGTDWLLARVGWPRERDGVLGSSISYDRVPVANIVLIDKATGGSVALLPNERNLVKDHWMVWPIAGVVDGNPSAGEGADAAELPAPTHFMLDAELRDARGKDRPGSRRLLIGSLDDFASSLVARGYSAIHHAEMLDATRLSILLGYPDHDELLVIDLPANRIVQRKWIEPARVAR